MKRKKHRFLSFVIFILVVILVALVSRTAYDAVIVKIYPKDYSEYVEEYADSYGIDSTLLYAVIKTESGFDKNAESSLGARGLTQITEDTFDWLLTKTGEDYSFEDLYTPEISIKYGAYFLSILKNEYGVTETAIAAYHAGMGNVSSWLKDSRYSDDGSNLTEIPIAETKYYVHKVTSAIEKYKDIYNK